MPLVTSLRKHVRDWLDYKRLGRLSPVACDVTNLRPTTSTWLRSVLEDRAAATQETEGRVLTPSGPTPAVEQGDLV